MKRKAPAELMARMRRVADATVARKRVCLGGDGLPVANNNNREEEVAPVAEPVRLVLSAMRAQGDPALVYRSPAATGLEHAQEPRLLARYLALGPREPLWQLQREAVDFMAAREAEGGAGLLCDEMGLGKSKSALQLVLEAQQRAAARTGRRFGGGATLVVCRHILIKSWLAELALAYPRDAFDYYVLTSDSRNHAQHAHYFHACCDLVFTTYSTVAACWRRQAAGAPLWDVLFGQAWARVLADEAHVFVVQSTVFAASVLALRAPHRWVLSGTPLQNRTSDLVMLLRFAGCELARARAAEVQAALRTHMLRRTRASLVPSALGAPSFKSVTRRVQLVQMRPVERLLYGLYAKYALLRQERAATRVTQLILIMRQLCIAPALVRDLVVPHGLRIMGPRDSLCARKRRRHEKRGALSLRRFMHAQCGSRGAARALHVTYTDATPQAEVRSNSLRWEPRFQEEEDDYYEYLCEHLAQTPGAWALQAGEVVSAWPRQPLARTQAALHHIRQHTLRLDTPSSKEAAVLAYVAAAPAGDKLVIYSNFVGVLRSLAGWLQAAQERVVLVTGSTANQATNDALLDEFQCDAGIRVLLITLKLGGEGLNIACANHLLMVDPWWNPAVLEQAEFRLQRASQQKLVYIVYFVCEDTIEGAMLAHSLQKKSLLAALLARRETEALGDESEEEEEEETMDARQLSLLFNYRVDIDRV